LAKKESDMCAARKQSKGKATIEGEKEFPQNNHLSKTTDQNGSALTPSAQDIGERVSRWRASEEEQREFASKYPAELIISFGGSKPIRVIGKTERKNA
jgi:hypothetical protein